jgi:general secretion pathway protein I
MQHCRTPSATVHPPGRCPGSPSGITLLEVLIALAIFLGAVTVVGQIVSTGSQAAIEARQRAEAVHRCETVLAEALAGSIPLQTSGAAFEDNPDWSWNMSVGDGPLVDLLAIEVVVVHTNQFGDTDQQFTLDRWVRDPELFLQTITDSTESLF